MQETSLALSEVVDERSCDDGVRDASAAAEFKCRQLVKSSLNSNGRYTNIANHLEKRRRKYQVSIFTVTFEKGMGLTC